MESWLPAIFGLGGVLIGSLFSLWLTKLQLRNADKKFERELAKAREDAQRQRRWEIRSVPLLKLRDELAVMATKLRMLVIDTREQHYRSNITDEEKNKELERATEELRVYQANGDFLQTVNLQYDAELLMLVWDIRSYYQLLFRYALRYKSLRPDEEREFSTVSQEIATKIPKIQELINKRLEEL